jgi:hypothetical protein
VFGSVDPSRPASEKFDFKNQIHDYDPGNVPGGLLWTVPLSPESLTLDLPNGTARLKVTNLAVPDYGSIPNALLHGAKVPATVSFDIVWRDVIRHVEQFDLSNSWTADLWETGATIEWSARQDGFEFASDRAETTKVRYGVIGRERNGRFASSGHLAASSSGVSTRYSFEYPGDESVYTINLQVSPDNGDLLNRAGFRIYGPNGSVQTTGGAQTGLKPNVSANVTSRTKGRHVVEIYNYNQAVPIDYALSLSRGLQEGRTA